MPGRITRLVEPLLRLLTPSAGRHRRDATTSAAEDRNRAEGPAPHQFGARPLRGEDHVLVRPYLVAHERRERERRQRARRRTLLVAVHGIRVGPGLRPIRDMETTA